MGFTTDYVTAVWVGNDDNSPTRGVTGGTLPAQIWKATMLTAEKGLPLKGLNRSPPQAPNVPEDVLASGASSPPALLGDDEAASAMARTEPPAQSENTHRRSAVGRILGWIFGDDDEDLKPPAPPSR